MSTDSQVSQINAALEEPPPEMGEAPQTVVELTIGIEIDDDWVTTAIVRELTGEDEEHLASFENKKDLLYAEYMSEVLKLAVVSIGDFVVSKSPSIIHKLTLADRDTLYLGIVKATYGESRELRSACPSCGESNDILLSLDEDFPIRKPSFDPRVGLEVKTHKATYHLRLPTGEDMVSVQKKTNNVAEFNTHVLANCVMFEGKAPKDRIAWAKKLNVGERKKLIDTLLGVEVGPDMKEVNAQCAACEKDIPLVFDWVSLLLS